MSALNSSRHAVLLIAVDALIRSVASSAGDKAVLSDADHISSKAGGTLRGETDISDDAGLGAGGGGEAAGGALVKLIVEGGVLSDEGGEVLLVVATDPIDTETKGESEKSSDSKKI